MREWHKIEMDTVLNGSDQNGVRYLPEFLTDYESTFNGSANAGCRKCLIQYYNKISKHLNNMNTENAKCNFKLKVMFEGIQVGFGSNKMISNRNITDATAIELLDNHAHGAKLFEVIPENLDEIRSAVESGGESKPEPTRAEVLADMTRAELDVVAEGIGLVPKDYSNKAKVTAAITEKEDIINAIETIAEGEETDPDADGGDEEE